MKLNNNISKFLSGILFVAFFVSLISFPTQLPNLNELGLNFQAQVSSAGQPSFTFSHNNGVLVVGVDRWTMSLVGGERGDKLTLKAWKDNVEVNRGNFLRICAVGWRRTGCTQTGRPTRRDIGHWVEKVFINDVERGQISFDVRARATTPPTQPTASAMSFTFSFTYKSSAS